MKKIKVEVKNLRLRTYIGIFDIEQQRKQDVVISYSFSYDAAAAVAADSIDGAKDYKGVTKKIISLVEENRYHLLETMADRIHELIEKNLHVDDIYVAVEKPHALRFSDTVKVIRTD